MKKHIDIFQSESGVRDALKDGTLNKPFTAYVVNDNRVHFNDITFIDYIFNGGEMNNTASVDYYSTNVYLYWHGYTSFYYEMICNEDWVTIPDATGRTSYYAANIGISQNETESARTATITVNWRDTEQGAVVWSQVFTINQNYEIVFKAGWLVDGSITTDTQYIDQTGGTLVFAVKNASSWSLLDDESTVLASGTTDGSYTINYGENVSQDEKYYNYICVYSTSDSSGSFGLGVSQGALVLPEPYFTVDAFVPNADYRGQFLIANDATSYTVTIENLVESDIWHVMTYDGNIGDYVDVASGTSATSASCVCEENIQNQQTSPQQMDNYTVRIERWNGEGYDIILEEELYCFKLPVNACIFTVDSYDSNEASLDFNQAAHSPKFVAYNGQSNITGQTLTSSSPDYDGNWGLDSEDWDYGKLYTVNPTYNMASADVVVNLVASYADGSELTASTTMYEYKDPDIADGYYKWMSSDKTKAIAAWNRNPIFVYVQYVLPTDEVTITIDGNAQVFQGEENAYWYTYVNQNDSEQIIYAFAAEVTVVRNGATILNKGMDIYQGSHGPSLFWVDNPENGQDYEIEGGANVYDLVAYRDDWSVSSNPNLSVTPNDWSVVYDGNVGISLTTTANETGSDINGEVSIFFTKDGVDTGRSAYFVQFPNGQ